METEIQNVALDGTTQPSTKSPSPDLSAEIARSVEKQPGERVKCTRVYGDNYRVNWVAPDDRVTRTDRAVASSARDRYYGDGAKALQTFYVRRSKFVRATMHMGKLTVEDLTASAGRN